MEQSTEVIVIGSGIGGLCCAALLAKYGFVDFCVVIMVPMLQRSQQVKLFFQDVQRPFQVYSVVEIRLFRVLVYPL